MKLQNEEIKQIKEKLDRLLSQSEVLKEHARDKDPIGLLYNYKNKRDQEAAAFIVSTLSYGKQDVFRPVVARLLKQLGKRPVDYLLDTDPATWETKLDWFRYRFNSAKDVCSLLLALRVMYKCGWTLETVFRDVYDETGNVYDAAANLVEYLRDLVDDKSAGFFYLIPSPKDGSACKRLNMFLRWMVRKDAIDVGNWTGIPTSALVIPLDTHVARISRNLGLTNKSGSTWKVAEDITDSLRYLCPEDPLIYDFPICTAGILGAL
jgi:uncharacterized protein (TIGR02757 family)